VPIGAFLALDRRGPGSARLGEAVRFVVPLAVGGLGVVAVQQTFYGSPLATGYGSPDALFAAGHVGPNADRYVRWLNETVSPAWWLAFAAPVFIADRRVWLYLSLFLCNVACYLPYVVFDEWWYLRFLLPAIPLVIVLVLAVASGLARRVRPGAAPWVAGIVAAVLVAVALPEAERRQAFRLHDLESRFVRAGRAVADRLPSNAIVVTSWQSGSVRHYSGRTTLVWDGLDGAWLDRALAFLESRGLAPFLLLESWEEPLFRERFHASPIGRLDWPPSIEIGGVVRVFRPADRARYLAGASVPTEYVR